MSEATPPGQSPPGEAQPDEAALAGQQRLQEQVVRTGMFGTETTGDTSGYGGLQVRRAPLPSTPRPEMLLDSIVKLHDKIQNMKLGVNREREITELEQARLRRLPLLAGVPGAQQGGASPEAGEHQ